MPTAIPSKLRGLLQDSDFESGVLDMVKRCDQILDDNKMPFFPAYTDHGTAHTGAVLEAVERLTPELVWEAELLRPEDAAVLIGACLLHDIALHLREPGFLALVSTDTPFKPLPWFDEDQRGRPADSPWPDIWQAFRKEARRFSVSDLERIFGPDVTEAPAIAFGEADTKPETWTERDRLLIGEFLRRHHARLAHEVAIFGFPGIEPDLFPVLAETLPTLADPIGVTARSHNEDLRIAAEYLDDRSPGDLRPDGALQLYLMALLRIADYFQLDVSRATPLLLHLREPQSPVSLDEWDKHRAVSGVSWENQDPHAARIRVTASHNLRTHLQLGELIGSLQRELDVTSAVLSETYGSTSLDPLQLTLQRVKTNLHEPALHRQLDFVPLRACPRSAEDLFRLVVGDLYGNEPAVAGRELLQNAIDAVRELKGWLERRGGSDEQMEFREIDDVLVEVREIDDEHGLLRVVDRGIGMTPEIVVDSFLTAGSTFRESFDAEEVDPAAALRWMKAGRFGVGVFASYLLGDEVRVTTRHVDEKRGISFSASMDDDLVQIDWDDEAPFGTEIVVPFRFDQLPLPFEWDGDREERFRYFLEQIESFYKLETPSVAFLLRDREDEVEVRAFIAEIPSPEGELPDSWRAIEVADFDAVLWSLPAKNFRLNGFLPSGAFGSRLAHNGIVIRKPEEDSPEEAYEWGTESMERLLRQPSVAVFDTRDRLGIALNRYELADRRLPFEETLLGSVGVDIVAHALTCGPEQHPFGKQWGLSPIHTATHFLPLLPGLTDRYLEGDLLVLFFIDPWEDEIEEILLDLQLEEEGWPPSMPRVALTLDEIYVDSEFDIDDRQDSSFPGKVVRSAISFGRMINRDPVACASFSAGELVRLDLGHGVDDEAQHSLGVIAEQLAELRSGLSIAGAVMRAPEGAPNPRDEAIADPWIEMIGGMLERDLEERDKRRDELAERVDGFRGITEAWERHARVPGWDD